MEIAEPGRSVAGVESRWSSARPALLTLHVCRNPLALWHCRGKQRRDAFRDSSSPRFCKSEETVKCRTQKAWKRWRSAASPCAQMSAARPDHLGGCYLDTILPGGRKDVPQSRMLRMSLPAPPSNRYSFNEAARQKDVSVEPRRTCLDGQEDPSPEVSAFLIFRGKSLQFWQDSTNNSVAQRIRRRSARTTTGIGYLA
ncbi:hypothetical protein BKA80DRAFT_130752 [Phyllosticta citrichinensis]